ncbi:hypothetical protein ABTZ93_15160 [Streptomyces sp. NPDC097941]
MKAAQVLSLSDAVVKPLYQRRRAPAECVPQEDVAAQRVHTPPTWPPEQ